MGYITGADIIERVTDTLQDKENIRWPRPELLRYINDAQREIINLRPDASAKTATVLLDPNTKQRVPDDGVRLLEVERNMGGGATPGKAIRLTAREVLDAQLPYWHVEPTSSIVTHYMFDIRNPKEFWVYPKPTAGVYASIVYSASPVDLDTESATISLDDIFANVIIAYVIMRAYQKDEDYARNADAANNWYAMMNNSMQARVQADGAVNPNNNLGADKSR